MIKRHKWSMIIITEREEQVWIYILFLLIVTEKKTMGFIVSLSYLDSKKWMQWR